MLRGLGVLAVWLVAVLVVAFIVIANFSATESGFRCEGEITAQGGTRPATLFMRLTEYRWWVKLWRDSDGMVSIEAPKEGMPYEPYLYLDKVGDSERHIYESSGVGNTDLKGAYYKLSNHLKLDTSRGFFEGECVPLRRED